MLIVKTAQRCPAQLSDVVTVQVALLDVNNTAGKTLKEALDKQYGRERTLFLSCDVESEEQIKGNTHAPTHTHLEGNAGV